MTTAQTPSTLWHYCAWIFGVFFMIMTLISLATSLVASLLLLVVTGVTLPPSFHILQKKFSRLVNTYVRIGIGSIALLMAISAFGSNMDDSYQQQPADKKQVKSEYFNEKSIQDDQRKIFDYEIVYELSDKRYDGAKSYFVLVKNIELQSDDFKNRIKNTIYEITKTKGKKLSIELVDNKNTLDLIYKSHYGSNTLGRILNEGELNDVAQSLIVTFDGQMESGTHFNTLSFFPGAFTDHPVVGNYVETIEYSPNS